MNTRPVTLLCFGLAGLAVVTAAVAEVLARCGAEHPRCPIYAGGLAGIALGLAGVPFAAKLARMREPGGAFWKWWGGGLLARLFLMLALAMVLGVLFHEQAAAPLLTMGAVYVVAMLGEAAWLARRVIEADKR